MRRRLRLAVCLVALALAPAVSAHVLVSPPEVEPGATQALVFSAPNERSGAALTEVSIVAPPGFAVDEVEAKAGWEAAVSGRTVRWSGGRVPPGQFVTFTVSATAPERRGTLVFSARETFADGLQATFPVPVVVRSADAARAARDSGARTLGKAALGVAIAAALAALLGGFLALYVWLRSPARER